MEVEVGNGSRGIWSWPWLARERVESLAQQWETQRASSMQRRSAEDADPAADAEEGAGAAEAASGPSTSSESERLSSQAARHRLANEDQVVDLQAFANTLVDILPYLLLFSFLLVFKFQAELLQLLTLIYVQMIVNREVRSQVSRKKDLQMEGLLRITAIVGTTVLVFLLLTDWVWLVRGALLLPPLQRSSTVATTIKVVIIDAFVRLLWTVPKLSVLLGFKLACSLGPGAKCSNAAASRVQGRLLTMAEHLLLLYRTALPAQMWYSYLLHSSNNKMVCSVLTGTYLVLKLSDLKHHWALACTAARIALRGGASWGTYVDAAPQAGASAQEQAALQRPSQPGQRRRQMTLSPVIMSLAARLPVRWQQEQQQEQQQHSTTAEAAALDDAGADVEAGTSGPATEGTCPVCHDTVTVGVKLDCSHVFCEDCICEWLERHRTCPMCRVEVKPPGLTSHGDGASSLLPIIF